MVHAHEILRIHLHKLCAQKMKNCGTVSKVFIRKSTKFSRTFGAKTSLTVVYDIDNAYIDDNRTYVIILRTAELIQ